MKRWLLGLGRSKRRRDDPVHRHRAEVAALVEANDLDQMLEAINDRRRRTGRRQIGEELADELARGTWDTEPGL